jgi:predicted amidohydrolase
MQMDLAWEYGAVNRARAEVLLEERQPPAGALVVLPEMFTTGFSMNVATVAEPAGGPTQSWLEAIARRWDICLLAGLARRDSNARCGNDALAIGPDGKCLAVYRKQRPFSPGGEDQHYAAGSECVDFEWKGVRVAPFICYDLRFPELFRMAALRRPELFAVIASWPEPRIEHWVRLLQARAIENQAYVLGVNRIGDDPTHHYPGRSLIVNPSGEIIADAAAFEGFVEADLDLEALGSYRKKLAFLDDLRPLPAAS